MYGPTECTVDSTVARIRVAGRRPVIGRPVSNAKHYILDGYLQPVPVGVVGELHIGGEAVGRGYLNRPEMTAEKFIPDLFSGEPGGRLYKTGDLVRCLPDGNIECLGRADHQVKIRGFRIELGEIEAVLSEHPDLKDATVWPWEEGGRKRLAAYVVPRRNEIQSDTADLRDFLRQRLPDYMIPSAFIFMDELPLTPNRKVDRRALPAPDESQAEQLMKQYVAPTTTEETVLADIWAEVLGIKQVGVYDNFFELGGDSILSIQVIARANQAGLRLTPRKLFEAPTVAELAKEAGKAPAIQAEQGIVEGPVPLTPIMHWFFSQDLPEPHHFNQSILFEVQEALDPLFLQRALGYLLEHHDALRLRFKQRDTGWEATNAGVDGVVPFEWIDLSKVAKEDHAREIEVRAAGLQASLDLINGPLMRVAYFHLGELPDRLVIIIHHLAVDVISWRILLEDLLGAYRQLKAGESVRLPCKTTPFRDWARRLSEYALTDAVQRDLPHWRAILKRRGTPLPVDYPGGSKAESLAREIFISLTPEETDFLVEKVKGVFGTEVEEVLLTALATSVSKWSGSERIVIDLEGHGREDLFEDMDISRTVGWFTALRPVTLKVRKTDDIKSTLLSVKEQLRKTPTRGLTYGLLAYSRTLSNDLKWDHLSRESEIIFNYVGMIDKMLDKSLPVRFSEGSIGSLRSPQWKRRHSFVINGGIFQGSVRLKWSYSAGLYSSDSVKRLTEDFIGTLRDIIEECRSFDREIYTPSDFPELELDQSDIDALMSEIGSETHEGQPTRLA
jgi:non-ribosomal peptide synthase protein (TIGR01720 family)